MKEQLGNIARQVGFFIGTHLNPFGCGYVNYNGEMHEVHDHDDSQPPVVLTDLFENEPYDPEIHGPLLKWLEEGEDLPKPSGKTRLIHVHDDWVLQCGPHECKPEKPKE
jgi:hypothetical protein